MGALNLMDLLSPSVLLPRHGGPTSLGEEQAPASKAEATQIQPEEMPSSDLNAVLLEAGSTNPAPPLTTSLPIRPCHVSMATRWI